MNDPKKQLKIHVGYLRGSVTTAIASPEIAYEDIPKDQILAITAPMAREVAALFLKAADVAEAYSSSPDTKSEDS